VKILLIDCYFNAKRKNKTCPAIAALHEANHDSANRDSRKGSHDFYKFRTYEIFSFAQNYNVLILFLLISSNSDFKFIPINILAIDFILYPDIIIFMKINFNGTKIQSYFFHIKKIIFIFFLKPIDNECYNVIFAKILELM